MPAKLPAYTHRFRVLASALLAAICLTIVPARISAQNNQPTTGQILAAPRLNVRVRPSDTAAVIGKLPQGAAVEIVAVSDDGTWYRVSSPLLGSSGWVAAAFVATDTQTASTPSATATT